MHHNKTLSISIKIVAVAFVVFHLYTAAIGLLLPLYQRSIHVMFGLILTFALVPMKKRNTAESRSSIPIWDWTLITITLFSGFYIVVNLNPA